MGSLGAVFTAMSVNGAYGGDMNSLWALTINIPLLILSDRWAEDDSWLYDEYHPEAEERQRIKTSMEQAPATALKTYLISAILGGAFLALNLQSDDFIVSEYNGLTHEIHSP